MLPAQSLAARSLALTRSHRFTSVPVTTNDHLHLTITTAIHARWAHRVDGLIHSHPWSLEATVEGPTDADKVIPADDLEQILHRRRRTVARALPHR